MKLSIIDLENRLAPSLYADDRGDVIFPNGQFVQPFGPTFLKANSTAGQGDIFVVGAAPGGGPRVQVIKYDEVNPPVVLADFFAYETQFHGGVAVSTDGKYVVTGAESDGGPVVAVFDTAGNQISRFFAFSPAFNGGISVQISDGTIYVTPGKGGGPVVAEFDIHGTPLGAFYGAPPSGRTGYSVLVVPDPVGVKTVDLVQPDGMIWVNYPGVGQYQTHLPNGFTQSGFSNAAFSFAGNGYLTGFGIDLGFNELAPLQAFDDHAAGNPNPPPTTGFREGVYFSDVSSFPAASTTTPTTTAKVTVLSGESVGSNEVGTGTLYLPMADANGTTYAVTASHVTDENLYQLVAPGPADGATKVTYGYPTIWTNYRTGPYSVDAAAVPTTQPLTSAVYFDGVYYPIEGIVVPKVGDELIAVGRGNEPGVGVYQGPEVGSVNVDTGYSGGAQLSGQYVVGPSVFGPLAIPGFSGGPVFDMKVDASGIHRYLVGMVIAGDGDTTYVTPADAVAKGLGLRYVI